MKKILVFIIVVACCKSSLSQIGLGITTPHPNAYFQINSTNKGVLLPRMTAIQRIAIAPTATANGLIVFDTDSSAYMFWTGSIWKKVGGDEGNWIKNGNNIYNSNSGNVGIGTSNPLAKLHITDSAVVFSGPAGQPDFSSTVLPPIEGAGRRMMWFPERAAFRAGYANGTEWDRDSIGNYSFAFGNGSKAKGFASTAFSYGQATGDASFAGGFGNATGLYTLAFGDGATASGAFAFANGEATIASGNHTIAFGSTAEARGNFSFAMGEQLTRAGGLSSFAFGLQSRVGGNYSFGMGRNVSMGNTSEYSFGFGENVFVGNSYSLGFGKSAFTTGFSSFAIGNNTQATDSNAIAFGTSARANNIRALAIGSNARASNINSVAVGFQTFADGEGSVALGVNTRSQAAYSFAAGYQTFANSYGSTTLGTWNDNNEIVNNFPFAQSRVFQIGNGTDAGNRKNALTVLRNGNTGFGALSPLAPIHIEAASNQKIILSGNDLNNNVGIGENAGTLLLHASNIQFGSGSAISFTPRMHIDAVTGNIGIGTISPQANLDINGNIRIANGTEAFGKVLTSDANGLANWQNISSSYWAANGNDIYNSNTGNVGIGITTAISPLSFANSLGNKISLYGNSSSNQYGLGIQGSLFQVYSSDVVDDIAFGYGSSTNFTERMRIKGNGNVGIGTSNPQVPLQFANSFGTKISLYQGTYGDVGMGVHGGELRLQNDIPIGKVSFGVIETTGTYTELARAQREGAIAFSVNGSIWVNTITYASDERFKQNITAISSPLQKLKQLNGVEYEMKTKEFSKNYFTPGRQIGLLAQNVEQIFPEAVSENADGYKGVDYARLVPLLLEGIKELDRKNETLETKNQSLEERVILLEEKMNQLLTGKR